jgi:hypothetical protein
VLAGSSGIELEVGAKLQSSESCDRFSKLTENNLRIAQLLVRKLIIVLLVEKTCRLSTTWENRLILRLLVEVAGQLKMR